MTKASTNRVHKRRAKAAVAGAVGKAANNALDSLRKDVNSAFQTLNDNQIKLGQMFNERREALERAFTLVDAHQYVSRRILNDMYWNRVRPTPLHEDDVAFLEELEEYELEARLGQFQRHGFLRVWGQEIDYEWYFEQYNLHHAVVLMFAAMRKFLGLEDVPKQTEVQSEEEEQEQDLEFGGDFKHEPHQEHGDARQADSG